MLRSLFFVQILMGPHYKRGVKEKLVKIFYYESEKYLATIDKRYMLDECGPLGIDKLRKKLGHKR